MKLLFVSKRRPQQRDLLQRPYGRFHHLPRALASKGHDVHLALISHGGDKPGSIWRDGLEVSTRDLRRAGPIVAIHDLQRTAHEFAPDWVVGCSDAWVGCLAAYIAHQTRARLVVDAYDNYEAYMPWNLPLHLAWRRTLRVADVVTAAGPQLAELLQRSRCAQVRSVDLVPMAADPAFVPHDRRTARTLLGLPQDTSLVGYAGGWAANRGTDVLLAAFALVRASRPGVRLVLTGHPPAHALATEGVLPLGYVEDAKLPYVLSAIDVACVITSDSAFGRYSYPAKLCEAMACGVPIVATDSDPVRWMLAGDTRFLAPIDDADGIATQILANLGMARVAYPALPTWGTSGDALLAALGSTGLSV
jgi:glycosyltransferase involved in cell wall biosynthesis